jgi:hypothetical protein
VFLNTAIPYQIHGNIQGENDIWQWESRYQENCSHCLIVMKATAVFPSLNIKMHNNLFLKNLAEDLRKGYRIIYCNNPESQKMVVGAITACNTANMCLDLGGTDCFACIHILGSAGL